MDWDEAAKEWIVFEEPETGEVPVWPVDEDGEQNDGMESESVSAQSAC